MIWWWQWCDADNDMMLTMMWCHARTHLCVQAFWHSGLTFSLHPCWACRTRGRGTLVMVWLTPGTPSRGEQAHPGSRSCLSTAGNCLPGTEGGLVGRNTIDGAFIKKTPFHIAIGSVHPHIFFCNLKSLNVFKGSLHHQNAILLMFSDYYVVADSAQNLSFASPKNMWLPKLREYENTKLNHKKHPN